MRINQENDDEHSDLDKYLDEENGLDALLGMDEFTIKDKEKHKSAELASVKLAVN